MHPPPVRRRQLNLDGVETPQQPLPLRGVLAATVAREGKVEGLAEARPLLPEDPPKRHRHAQHRRRHEREAEEPPQHERGVLADGFY